MGYERVAILRDGASRLLRMTAFYAASTRRKPFHIAVAAPEVSTG
jgi:hypothetical protein